MSVLRAQAAAPAPARDGRLTVDHLENRHDPVEVVLFDRLDVGSDGAVVREPHRNVQNRAVLPALLRRQPRAVVPALDGVEEKLLAGASVADIACGHGASTICYGARVVKWPLLVAVAGRGLRRGWSVGRDAGLVVGVASLMMRGLGPQGSGFAAGVRCLGTSVAPRGGVLLMDRSRVPAAVVARRPGSPTG